MIGDTVAKLDRASTDEVKKRWKCGRPKAIGFPHYYRLGDEVSLIIVNENTWLVKIFSQLLQPLSVFRTFFVIR